VKFFNKALLVVAMSIFVLGISGCKEKGPAEKAGEKLDQTIGKAADKASDLLGK